MLSLYITSIEENSEKQIITTGLASIMQSLGYSVCVYKPVQIDGYFDDGKMFSKEFDYITQTDEFIDIFIISENVSFDTCLKINLSLNNASWNGGIGFESLTEASYKNVKRLFL